jgi:hypothetical protein
MKKTSGDIYMGGYGDSLGTLEIAQIWAGGQQSEPPNLNMRAEIKMKPLIERGQQQPTYRSVTLLRINGEFRSPEHRVLARFQNDEPLFAQNPQHDAKAQVTFEIPLDVLTIHRIEEERNGGNLKVGLKLRMLFALHGSNGGVTFHGGGVTSDLIFVIPRSQWVEEYLPGLRYGGLEILEIRYGYGVAADGLRNSVAEIKEAKKSLAEGQWDQTALHCRKAIEGILTSKSPTASLPANRFDQRVNTLISDNLPGIDNAEAGLLSDQMNLIWKATSPSAHGTPQHPFKRPDAEFVLRMTMAIVEYFGRLLK